MRLNRRTKFRVAATASVTVLAALVGVSPAQAAASCPGGTICLYPGANYTGTPIRYSTCQFVDIGRVWGNDRIRSIQNNQSTGTITRFYNWYASTRTWQYVGYSQAKANHPTVSAGVASAEGLQVCPS